MEEREMAWRGVREESKEGRLDLTCNPCVMARVMPKRQLVEWCEMETERVVALTH